MAKSILIRPIITEKAQGFMDNENKYAFVVAKSANKIEIGKAIEAMYGFAPVSVNTLIVPGKTRSRMRGHNVARGMKSAYKKAYITLAEGDSINFYGDAEVVENEGTVA
jgi:large subunit ribosomal protein L23